MHEAHTDGFLLGELFQWPGRAEPKPKRRTAEPKNETSNTFNPKSSARWDFLWDFPDFVQDIAILSHEAKQLDSRRITDATAPQKQSVLQQTALGGSAEHQDAICAENHHENPVESTLNLELGFSSVLFGSLRFSQTRRRSKLAEVSSKPAARLSSSCDKMWKHLWFQFARSIGSRAFVWFIDLKEDSDRIKNHFDRFSTFAAFVSTTPRDVAKNLLRSVRLWCVVNYHHSQHHFLVEYPRRQREGPWPRQRLRWDPSKSSKKSNITERTEITSDKLLQILTKWPNKQSQLFSWLKLKLRSELWQVRCGFSRNLLTPGASQNCPAHVVTHCAMLWEAVAICLSNPIKSESNQNLIKLDMSCAFTFWCVPIYWVKKTGSCKLSVTVSASP